MKPSNGDDVVMDDESYFTLDRHKFAENGHYYSQSKENVSKEVKFKRKGNFHRKFAYGSQLALKVYRNHILKKLIEQLMQTLIRKIVFHC